MSENSEPEATGNPRVDEANGVKNVTVEFKGKTFTVPRNYGDWPYVYTLEVEAGHYARAFQVLLGDQFDKFVSLNPTNNDFGDFDEALAKAIGLAQGESEASSS